MNTNVVKSPHLHYIRHHWPYLGRIPRRAYPLVIRRMFDSNIASILIILPRSISPP